MPVVSQNDIRPDFICNNHHIILPKQFHRLFQLPSFPYSAARVMGRAEYRRVNGMLTQFFLHIRKIHPPYTAFILLKRTAYNIVTVILQTAGKSNISRGMEQYLVPFGTNHIQRAYHTAQYAVFITDTLFGQPLYAVPLFLPADNRLIIFFLRFKISI